MEISKWKYQKIYNQISNQFKEQVKAIAILTINTIKKYKNSITNIIIPLKSHHNKHRKILP